MPAMVSDPRPPSVAYSFANNFWGKDDAGVLPLLDRMHHAKETCDQLKAFFSTRAQIEDEYAKKLLNLARKSLGSGESGTVRIALDTVRKETEAMGKAHQNVASQMKIELDEPLAAFSACQKENRKIQQTSIEKLLKLKLQQTTAVNKTKDKYEQDCLKIKGYLAQGNMVMGQEERKINAKLEKTKIQVSSTSSDYEVALRALEETTGRWNRDWKVTCDKFQDLEEERIDWFKTKLWDYANIASTVCVSDDQAYERIRLSLEGCEVEKDIMSFIKIQGTGQEIPDPPKFIDYCRGDDNASEDGGESSYSVAQFSRPINPAHRTSSPQPSLIESHHDVHQSSFVNESRTGNNSIQASPEPEPQSQSHFQPQSQPQDPSQIASQSKPSAPYGHKSFAKSVGDVPRVPHNEYPQHGMTQFCRSGPPSSIGAASSFCPSDLGSNISSNVSINRNRPASRDSYSECSDPSRFSYEQQSSVQSSIGASPVKEQIDDSPSKKSSRSWIKSPFRKASKPEKEFQQTSRDTWGAATAKKMGANNNNSGFTSNQNQSSYVQPQSSAYGTQYSVSPEPFDPNAKIQLSVGNNIFDVVPDQDRRNNNMASASSQAYHTNHHANGMVDDPSDPLVQALDELSRVGSKVTNNRTPIAERNFRAPSPAPPRSPHGRASPLPGAMQTPLATVPHSYNSPINARSTLSAPPSAHTSREMQNITHQYLNQRRGGFESPSANRSQQPIRAASPAAGRRSPQPGLQSSQYRPPSSQGYRPPSSQGFHNPQPQPQATPTRPPPGSQSGYGASYASRGGSPGVVSGLSGQHVPPQSQQQYHHHQQQQQYPRARSPQPGYVRPASSMAGNMSLQLHNDDPYGRGRKFEDALSTRVRSKSAASSGQFTKDGRPILHQARAMYSYAPQIPEEMGFSKGNMLAVLRLQDDGWWEAELMGNRTARGLVPSNYLQVAER